MKRGFSIAILLIGALVFGLLVAGVAYYSMQTRVPSDAASQTSGRFPTNLRKESKKTMPLVLSNGEGQQISGKSVPVTIAFSNTETISGVALRLLYKGSLSDGLSVSGIKIGSDLINSGGWMCPIKSANSQQGVVNIDLACVNTTPDGYLPHEETVLASFELNRTSGEFTSPLPFQVQSKVSAMTRKSDGTNVLGLSGNLAIK